jgi:hypothetical protein
MGRRRRGTSYVLTEEWRAQLSAWLSAERGRAEQLARDLKVNPSAISLLKGRTRASDLVERIAELTSGEVPPPGPVTVTAREQGILDKLRELRQRDPGLAEMQEALLEAHLARARGSKQ